MFTLSGLIEISRTQGTKIDGRWYPSRPIIGPLWTRLRDAWYVITGKCDAVKWPHQ